MADKFRVGGSNTGDYYQIVNGKRQYFDKNGKPMEESVFLANNNAQIDKNGSMRRKQNVAKDGYVKQYYPGSKSGRYFTVDKNGTKHFYAADDTEIKEAWFNKKEQEWVEAAKAKKAGKKPVGKAEKAKSFWDDPLGSMKEFGKGMVMSVGNMVGDYDEKGNWKGFSLKKTVTTAATCAAVVAVGAALVAAEVFTAGQVTWLLVGVGAAMGAATAGQGVYMASTAETEEERLAGYRMAGQGTGEMGMSFLIKRGVKTQMSGVASARDAARMSALMRGKSPLSARMSGFNAGMKTVLPGSGLGDAIRHPFKTFRQMREARRFNNEARDFYNERLAKAKSPEEIAAIKGEVDSTPHLSDKTRTKLNENIYEKNRGEIDRLDAARRAETDPAKQAEIDTQLAAAREMEYARVRAEADQVALRPRRFRRSAQKRLENKIDNNPRLTREQKIELKTHIDEQKALLKEIDDMPKHPTEAQYKAMLDRCENEETLLALFNKIAGDRNIFGRFNPFKRFRSQVRENRPELLKDVYAKLQKLNPEKYTLDYTNLGAAALEERITKGKNFDKTEKKINEAYEDGKITKAKRDELLSKLENARTNAKTEAKFNELMKEVKKNDDIDFVRVKVEKAKDKLSKEQYDNLMAKLEERAAQKRAAEGANEGVNEGANKGAERVTDEAPVEERPIERTSEEVAADEVAPKTENEASQNPAVERPAADEGAELTYETWQVSGIEKTPKKIAPQKQPRDVEFSQKTTLGDDKVTLDSFTFEGKEYKFDGSNYVAEDGSVAVRIENRIGFEYRIENNGVETARFTTGKGKNGEYVGSYTKVEFVEGKRVETTTYWTGDTTVRKYNTDGSYTEASYTDKGKLKSMREYDRFDNLTKRYDAKTKETTVSGTDEAGHSIETVYDKKGRIKQVETDYESESIVVSVIRDAKGNLKKPMSRSSYWKLIEDAKANNDKAALTEIEALIKEHDQAFGTLKDNYLSAQDRMITGLKNAADEDFTYHNTYANKAERAKMLEEIKKHRELIEEVEAAQAESTGGTIIFDDAGPVEGTIVPGESVAGFEGHPRVVREVEITGFEKPTETTGEGSLKATEGGELPEIPTGEAPKPAPEIKSQAAQDFEARIKDATAEELEAINKEITNALADEKVTVDEHADLVHAWIERRFELKTSTESVNTQPQGITAQEVTVEATRIAENGGKLDDYAALIKRVEDSDALTSAEKTQIIETLNKIQRDNAEIARNQQLAAQVSQDAPAPAAERTGTPLLDNIIKGRENAPRTVEKLNETKFAALKDEVENELTHINSEAELTALAKKVDVLQNRAQRRALENMIKAKRKGLQENNAETHNQQLAAQVQPAQLKGITPAEVTAEATRIAENGGKLNDYANLIARVEESDAMTPAEKTQIIEMLNKIQRDNAEIARNQQLAAQVQPAQPKGITPAEVTVEATRIAENGGKLNDYANLIARVEESDAMTPAEKTQIIEMLNRIQRDNAEIARNQQLEAQVARDTSVSEAERNVSRTDFEAEAAPNQGEQVSTEFEVSVRKEVVKPAEEIVTSAFDKAEFEINIKTKIRDVKKVTEYDAIREEIRNSELSDTEKAELLSILERDRETRFPKPEETPSGIGKVTELEDGRVKVEMDEANYIVKEGERFTHEGTEYIVRNGKVVEFEPNANPFTPKAGITGNPIAKTVVGLGGAALAGNLWADSKRDDDNVEEPDDVAVEEHDETDAADEADEGATVGDTDDVGNELDEPSNTDNPSYILGDGSKVSENDIKNMNEEQLKELEGKLDGMNEKDRKAIQDLIDAQRAALAAQKRDKSETDNDTSTDVDETRQDKSPVKEQVIEGRTVTVEKDNDGKPIVKVDGNVAEVNPDGTVTINGKKYRLNDDGTLTPVEEKHNQPAEFDRSTYKVRIQSPSVNGEKPEINGQQVVAFTNAIKEAGTEEDLNKILSDIFAFKMFKGRKQLRTAIRAKRKALQHENDAAYVAKKEAKVEKKTDRAVERFEDKRKSFLGIRIGKKEQPAKIEKAKNDTPSSQKDISIEQLDEWNNPFGDMA